jgi:hypothetical protein
MVRLIAKFAIQARATIKSNRQRNLRPQNNHTVSPTIVRYPHQRNSVIVDTEASLVRLLSFDMLAIFE